MRMNCTVQMEWFSTKCNFNPRKPVRCDTIPGETWKKYMLTGCWTNVWIPLMKSSLVNKHVLLEHGLEVTDRSRKSQRQLHHQKPPPTSTGGSDNIWKPGATLHSSTVRGCPLLVLSLAEPPVSCSCWSLFILGTSAELLSILVCRGCQVFFPTRPVWEWFATVFSL